MIYLLLIAAVAAPAIAGYLTLDVMSAAITREQA